MKLEKKLDKRRNRKARQLQKMNDKDLPREKVTGCKNSHAAETLIFIVYFNMYGHTLSACVAL